MTATLARSAPHGNSAHAGRVAKRFAEATGRTAGSASQRLTGRGRLLTDALAFLRICREEQRCADGEAFLHACDEAFRGTHPEAWRAELVDEVAMLDGIEDGRLVAIAQKVQAGTATEKEVLEYAKLLMREIAGKLRLYDAAIALTHRLRSQA